MGIQTAIRLTPITLGLIYSGRNFHAAGRTTHAHPLRRRWAGGPVLRAACQAGRPAARNRRRRAQQAVRHVRLGRRVLRPDARQSRARRPADARRDQRSVQPLGRHRRPFQGPNDHVGRPRLLRHRSQAAAEHPAAALRSARRAAGLDRMSADEGIAFCERLFARYLDGNALMTNARHLRGSAWINFLRVANRTWVNFAGAAPIVLVGDAAHTAHFSVGSGTKLALEDAIALARAIDGAADLRTALATYESERMVEVLKIQNAARNSTEWFESVDRYTGFEAEQFAYSLLTRSQRISHENLRLRDDAFVSHVESWFAQKNALPAQPVPPMFTPFRLRGVTLENRVVVSPMAQYSCRDGTPDDYYLV